MKTQRLLKTTLLAASAALLISGCGSDSSDGGDNTNSTPSESAEVLTLDEMFERSLGGVVYLSTFEHTQYLDASKAGTAVDTTFACDSGSADVRIVYVDAESSTLALSNFNSCLLNGILIPSTTSILGITISTQAGADATRSMVYSIEAAVGVQHQISANYNHLDNSYRAGGTSRKIIGEPFYSTSVILDLFGSYDSAAGTHAVISGDLGSTESNESGTTLIYDYTFDYQNNNTLYFASDIIGQSDYEYMIP